MRIEKDSIGELSIPENSLYGIHSLRACNNFPSQEKVRKEWYQSIALVKLAYFLTYEKYREALLKKYPSEKIPFQLIDNDILENLKKSASQASKGDFYESFIVPAIQGGAGTSMNMNVNEIICNNALLLSGKNPGDYQFIDPFLHANVFQSTNDVIPSSLKICCMQLFNQLEQLINESRQYFEKFENEYRFLVRIAYTQMQEAVPSTYGRLFSTYSEAFSRDWWRISKCNERLKLLNLGGGATGTSLGIPRFMVMEVTKTLKELTGLPIARSENMSDATCNLDAFVETHAILKSHAVNLEKIVNDIRLLASDLSYGEVKIPQLQTGSSIMPGKINPVIPEYIISISHKVYANDALITSLCSQGCLDLNAYIPTIGDAYINSIKLLCDANKSLATHLLNGLTLIQGKTLERFYKSPSLTTAIAPIIGYHKASSMATFMKEHNCTIYEANKELKLVSHENLETLLKPENLLNEGFTIQND